MTEQWDGSERRVVIKRIDRFTNTIPVVVFCTFVVLGVMSFGIVSNNTKANNSDRTVERLATCLLEQFTEHRENSLFTHDRQNEKLGIPYLERPSKGLTPDQLKEDIKTTCQEFLK